MTNSNDQIEKNVISSFSYVKKDIMMLNDAFSDLHEKISHLSLNHAGLLEELGRIRKELSTVGKKRIVSKKVTVIKTVRGKVAKSNKKDDLSKVEGIGSKIRDVLYKNKITTYKKLSKTSVKKLKKILSSEGQMMEMHDPTTWPAQATLASKNKWVELERLQKKLIGGVKK